MPSLRAVPEALQHETRATVTHTWRVVKSLAHGAQVTGALRPETRFCQQTDFILYFKCTHTHTHMHTNKQCACSPLRARQKALQHEAKAAAGTKSCDSQSLSHTALISSAFGRAAQFCQQTASTLYYQLSSVCVRLRCSVWRPCQHEAHHAHLA